MLASEAAPRADGWDFFVSYTGADRAWAEWVAWQLEDAGYHVLIQAWDFVPGTNWQIKMDEGVRRATRTIAILSSAYLDSVYGRQEWQAAQAADPDGFGRKLLPIRVEDCPRPGLLAAVVSIDLFPLPQHDAPRHLLEQISHTLTGRAKPTSAPEYPIRPRPAPPIDEPAFPPPARPIPTPPITGARPVGQPITGHTRPVLSVAFSADGHTLATASNDRTVRLWDVTDPTRPRPIGEPLTGHTRGVWSVAFSADQRTLASASNDRTVRLWDVTDPTRPHPIGEPLTGHADAVQSVAFSADGHTLATADNDQTVRLWDVTDPTRPHPIGQPLTGHTGPVWSVAFSADQRTLASASSDRTLRLWDVTDPTRPRPIGEPLTGHTSSVLSVAFTADGHTLATASNDQTVRLWQTY
ncbi:TIR domain-containing protein [Frankia sp. AgB1.9]|uniref:toll/interleukin-1 receptor domain-containing protein n=1 Tax=unclassified Frankia TaxID=2632575 RepID=UPI0019345A2C|nr:MULTISPECIES: TIR domain-containing protein [unclassified Frankia]MBL7489569.1 TIR domain-containing protein [Frankia sp. AgW1.1]MBL7550229.1 TIR domain-containing protein [Frankia sp. AgB1.9]MBL7619890.1 TIR domain-containing protein [Frankia sp. AgB1.8]